MSCVLFPGWRRPGGKDVRCDNAGTLLRVAYVLGVLESPAREAARPLTTLRALSQVPKRMNLPGVTGINPAPRYHHLDTRQDWRLRVKILNTTSSGLLHHDCADCRSRKELVAIAEDDPS